MKRSTHRLKVSNEARISSYCLDTQRQGPTVVLVGGVHGDEYTGVELCYRIMDSLAKELLCGRVVCYPCLNPAGAERSERTLPEQGGDLNRCFPGGERGARASRYAHAVWQDIIGWEPNFVFDIHADASRSVPYVIVDRPVLLAAESSASMMSGLIESARSLGCIVLLEYEERDYQRYGLQHSLAGSLVNFAGIPALTFEAGGRDLVDSGAVDVADRAVRSLLAKLEMLEPAPAIAEAPQPLWLRSTTRPVRTTGMFVPLIGPGERFRAGQHLAHIRQLDGQVTERISALNDGIVIAWRDIAWVRPGAVVGTLGEVVA
jgi:predicted deacylase